MTSADAIETSVPVAGWPIEIDERVLLYVVHDHAKWESDPVARQTKWEEWCTGYWTDFNGGGWVWNGICGHVTHVAPLVTEDDGTGDIIYPPRPTAPAAEPATPPADGLAVGSNNHSTQEAER